MSAYDKVLLARAKGRATGLTYVEAIFDDFIELHGDRRFSDDPAIVGGIACLNGEPVTVIAMEKGGDMKDKVRRNFGSPNPEGYRKALRLMKQAEKFHRPVVCFVDTSGAFCGLGAEERGQGQAIAENLVEMMDLQTPVISILIGEGGSGGMSQADRPGHGEAGRGGTGNSGGKGFWPDLRPNKNSPAGNAPRPADAAGR